MCTNLCFGQDQASFIKKRNNYTFDNYLKRKEELKLPKYISNYFTCLENSSNFRKKDKINQQKNNQIQCVNQGFFSHFKNLPQKQQSIYMIQLLKKIQIKGKQKQEYVFQKTLSIQTIEQKAQNGKYLQAFCKMSSTKTGFKSWKSINLKLNISKKRLTVRRKNIVFHIPIRSYMVRSAKSNNQSFILQTLHDYQQPNMRKLSFEVQEDEKLQEFYTKILEIIIQYQVDKLFMEVQFRQKMQRINNPCENKIKIFLTRSNIESYRNYLSIYQKDQKKSNQASITLFSDKKITVQKIRSKQLTFYKAFIQREDFHKPQTINFLQVYIYFHRCVTKVNIMEKNTEKNAQIVAVYQKLMINDNQYGQQLIIQKNRSENQQLLTMVNLDHVLNQNFIQMLKIKIAQGKPDKTILIQIEGKFNELFSENSILQYLKEFNQMFERLYQAPNQKINQSAFQQQKNSKFYLQKDLISKFGQQLIDQNFQRKGIKKSSFKEVPVNAYLKHKYRLNPTEQKIGKIMKIHFLYNEWQRIQKGGLRCKNQELIQFQKSLYKKVMKKFGQNLLKGKNIINFSLPVECFKKQSHLKSLANSMLYSPIYIEKASKIKNPVQRMKYAVVLMIAIGILTINTEKPFNPILGQTFQGWIDGCPIYLQQISHHPPISAYYMVGRGYKVYGCVQPRISLGFNSASGYSLLPHYIQFEDGGIIQIIFGRIIITGMLFGDRQFYFEDKIYSYDKANNYFAQLNFGPIKSGGIFSSSSQPEDYFHGKIYQVTKQFREYFQKSSPKNYPKKEHIVKQISMFDGIWSGTVHIDGEQYINFKNDLPYQFSEQDYPLPSDSRNRQDLKSLISGDIEQAQKNKQLMQQEQRNDKKLREKQAKKKK